MLNGSTDETNEQLTGDNCPVCGYPIVLEDGLEVCYKCGWYKGIEEQDNEDICNTIR